MTHRRFRISMAGLAATGALLLPGAVPAHAASAAGCAGTWSSSSPTQSTSCTFAAAFNAPESSYILDVSLSTTMDRTANVVAWVRLVDPSSNTLASCSTVGIGFCSGGNFSTAPQVPAGTTLTCVVEGISAGDYSCSTS